MPDPIIRSPAADAAAHNKEGLVNPPEGVEDASSALDKEFEKLTGRAPNDGDNVAQRDRDQSTDPEIKTASEMPEEIDGTPLTEEKPAEPTPEGKSKDTPAPEEKPKVAEPKSPADKLAEELLGKQEPAKPDAGKPEPKPEDDPYKDHKLRADASERTKNTFEDLKRTAREREQAARLDAEKYRKEAEEAKKAAEEAKKAAEQAAEEAKKRPTLPEDAEKELKELRAFRAQYGAETDPSFNKPFDERRDRNNATIFETLKRNGLKDETAEALKKLPYDQQVEQISKWAEKLSPRDKLTITARLTDNEAVAADREAKLAEVKSKAAESSTVQKQNVEAEQQKFVTEAVATLKPILPQLAWLHPKEIPATATASEKEALTKANETAAEAQRMLLGFLQDTSARTRSLLALSGILAPRYRAELTEAKATIVALTKELNQIKEAGRLSRTSRSSAPAPGNTPAGGGIDFNISADEAMDKMASELGLPTR